jgi:hypothetical protein
MFRQGDTVSVGLLNIFPHVILYFTVRAGKVIDFTGTFNLVQSDAAVTRLLEPYMDKNHIIRVNIWSSTRSLFYLQHNHKTDACGMEEFERDIVSRQTKLFGVYTIL